MRVMVRRNGPAGFPQLFLLDPDRNIIEITVPLLTHGQRRFASTPSGSDQCPFTVLTGGVMKLLNLVIGLATLALSGLAYADN